MFVDAFRRGEASARIELAATDVAAPAISRRKRALDLIVAATTVLLFLPVFILIAAAIRADSPGPALFRQQRTGLHGKPFWILKFRTMLQEPDAGVRQAYRGDTRVTRIGKLLRKLSLDELPQLLNVLKGEMSLVGPRPHALAHDQLWNAHVRGYEDRFRVRPGLTGLAQVRGYRGEIHDEDGLRMRIAADREYAERWSFTGDLWLMVRTLPLIVSDPHAY